KFNLEKRLKMSKEELKKLEEEQRKSHIFEVKNKIKDYILNNHFDTFLTLTFDPKKCDEAIEDSYRFEEMKKWLEKLRKRHNRKSDKPFNYIAIPERHKSGLIHWHVVTGNIDLNLVDSGKKFRNQKIYNCLDWEYGFSNVQRMRSKSKVSSYITKYITKDLLYSPVRKYKRKYWCNKSLELPEVYAGSYSDLASVLPLYDENGELKPTYSNDVCDIWVLRT
ncbi:rolling circle replication-associated protein, partial [Staphylococcus aureus]|uniref:rolling circle replication-associated protein n=1 Tax=Staphylococcus aureus TaxID=1280 RepID=UPI001293825C